MGQVVGGDVNVFEQYREESKALAQSHAAKDAMDAFYAHWLPEFLKVAASGKTEATRKAALINAEALANGLGRFDVSREVVNSLLSHSSGWPDQVRWYTELGEIGFAAYSKAGKPEDREASATSFGKAVDVATNHIDEVTQSHSLTRDFIVSANHCADTLSASREVANLKRAAAIYERAAYVLQHADPNVAATLGSIGYNRLLFFKGRISAYATALDLDDAHRALKELLKTKDEKCVPSEIFDLMIRSAYPQGGQKYWEEVATWTRENASDSYTPVMLFLYGNDLYNKGQLLKAIAIYEALLKNDRTSLEDKDKQGGVSSSGGYVASVLFNLAMAYAQLNQFDRTESLLGEFLRGYPDDSRAEFAGDELKQLIAHQPAGRGLSDRSGGMSDLGNVAVAAENNSVTMLPAALDGNQRPPGITAQPAEVEMPQQLKRHNFWAVAGVVCGIVAVVLCVVLRPGIAAKNAK